MRTPQDIVIIKVNKKEKSEHKVAGTDIVLHLPSNFREFEDDVVVQSGIVVATPMKWHKKDVFGNIEEVHTDVEIEVGDKVYCHHFIAHEEHDTSFIENDTAYIDYTEVYCKIVNGEIVMINNWNLLEIVEKEEKKGNLWTPHKTKEKTGRGIMAYPSKSMKEEGVVAGSEVEFLPKAVYIIQVEDKKYYRMRDEHILMVI